MASSSPTSNDILNQAQFAGQPQRPAVDAPTSAGILGAQGLDPVALHPLAGLIDKNKDIDYLLLDDEKLSDVEGGRTALPSRGWSDELCYGTGTFYLTGLAAGGVWGIREGLTRPLQSSKNTGVKLGSVLATHTKETATEAVKGAAKEAASTVTKSTSSPAFRLRWNAILNSVTRRGTFTGNNAGVIALMYNAFNSSLDAYRGGKHDVYGSMAAAALTGALFRCTAGIKPMAVTSGLLAAGAAGWSFVKVQFL